MNVGKFLMGLGAVMLVMGVGYMNGMAPLIATPLSDHRAWQWWEAIIPAAMMYFAGLILAILPTGRVRQ